MEEHLRWGGLEEEGWRKGPWTAEEDRLLIEYVSQNGEGRWNSVARLTGLRRNGKSCRLRWVNYLRPDLKKGQITPHEETIILELHARWGNRWSTIARSLPGRTDNEIKNYWRTHFKKAAKSHSDTNEMARVRFLKRQQFRQQQQEQQQQQQQQKINQMDLKKITSLLDENENRVPFPPQVWQEMVTLHLNTAEEQEKGFAYSMIGNYTSVPEAPNEDNVLWDGLWNLDDFHCNQGIALAANKACLHSLATPFY